MEKHTLREILKNNFDLQAESQGVYLVRSGGSSDKPLVFPVDIEENLYQRELLAIELKKYGMFSSKTVGLNLFSYRDMYRTAAIIDDILERCSATTIALGSGSSFELMYNTAIEFGANILMGTPSKLTLFAKYLSENNLNLAVKDLLYAGEYLLPSQVKLFKKVFNTKQIYSLYGSAETGIWGWSTYSENATSFEILEDIIVEIEHPDENGNGLIVVTNLLRKRFPVIRYLMGDIGHLKNEQEKRILTLKSREPKSFSIDANSYFLNDFDILLETIDRFQIQLSSNTPVQTAVNFLLIKADFDEEKANSILDKVRKELSLIFEMNPTFLNLQVELVSASDLYSNPTTSKTPILIDFRN